MSSNKVISPNPKLIILSPHFDENVRLVAGKCPKCFQESEDLKIVGVNEIFLEQTQKRKHHVKVEVEEGVGEKLAKVETRLTKVKSKSTKVETKSTKVDTKSTKLETKSTKVDIKSTKVDIKSTKVDPKLTKVEKVEDVKPEETIEKPEETIEKPNKQTTPTLSTNFPDSKPTLTKDHFFDPFGPPESYWKPVWIPPKSPHNLIEETLYHDPWALLVATIFLNKTSCYQARPVVEEFLKDNPTPGHVLSKNPQDLESYFNKIGLKKRAHQIWGMTNDFVYKNWKHARELHGIGKYGEDAFRMFCLGDLNVEPEDRFLKIYKAFAKMKEMDEGCSQRERFEEMCLMNVTQ